MTLRGRNVVVLVGAGFEDLEFWYPVLRFREAGADVTVLGVDGADVCSGRSGYPVAPDGDLATFDGQPTYVVVPGFAGYPLEDLRNRTSDPLASWAKQGARLIATSTGVDALALANLVAGSSVSCPPASEATVRGAGGTVSAEQSTVSGNLATAASVDGIAELFRLLARAWFSA